MNKFRFRKYDSICRTCPNYIKKVCLGECPPIQWINGKELPFEKPISPDSFAYRKFPKWPDNLSKQELICLMYFVNKLKQDEIAKELYVSQGYVSETINKYEALIIKTFKKAIKHTV